MKKLLYVFLAMAMVFAMGSCKNPTESTPRTPNSGATLEWITIGDVQRAEPLDPGPDLEDVLDPDYTTDFPSAYEIPLTESRKSGEITYGLPNNSLYAKVEFVQIAEADTDTADPEDVEEALDETLTGRTFGDGDWLVVKVTSEDGSRTRYYRFNVTLGRNAYLESVTIGTTPQKEEGYLGKPAADFEDIVIGEFQTDQIITTTKFIALSQDEDATVSYKFVNETGGAPTALPSDSLFEEITDQEEGVLVSEILDDLGLLDFGVSTYLYIKVEPTNPAAPALYYVTKLIIPKKGNIKYGVPKLVDPANPGSAFYIDPIWDSVDWDFVIDRANKAEIDNFFQQDYGRHTSAKAKALWDDNGIWVLVDADVSQFQKTQGGATLDRPLNSTGAEHEADSIEIFINERLQVLGKATSASSGAVIDDLGTQWRVGLNLARSGETGVAIAATTGVVADAKADMLPFRSPEYAKTRAVIKNSSGNYVGSLEEGTNGGYQIIAYAPFKFKSSANANAVFGSNGDVISGASIGFELQLNCNSGTGRDGILTWNGVLTQAYTHASGFGVVTLDRDSKPKDTKVFPEITAQALSDGEYLIDATSVVDLSVTSTGVIQWYSATSAYGTGTAIPSATNATYKPSTAAAGTTYYYAVVGSGDTRVVTNKRAKIVVGDASMFRERWVINNPPLSVAGTGAVIDVSNPNKVTVTTAGSSDAVFGYVFPVGDFEEVELVLDVVVVTAPTGGNAGGALKDGITTDDPANNTHGANANPDFTAGTKTWTYKLDEGAFTNGGIGWQNKAWGGIADGVYTVELKKATFTVKADDDATSLWATDGAVYLNLAGARSGPVDTAGNQWKNEYATPSWNADGTITLTYSVPGGTGNNNLRQNAIIEFTSQQLAKISAKDKWDIEIEVGAAPTSNPAGAKYRFGLFKLGAWDVSSLKSGVEFDEDVVLNATRAANGTDGEGVKRDPEGLIIQLNDGTSSGVDSTISIKSIKITPLDDD